jgi:uncharacterized protein (TIGR03643 family)
MKLQDSPLITGDLTVHEVSRIIEMAWEDRTPFDAIEAQFGIDEKAVIRLMRLQLKKRSFQVWRIRVSSRRTKHEARRLTAFVRHRCPTQNKIRGR